MQDRARREAPTSDRNTQLGRSRSPNNVKHSSSIFVVFVVERRTTKYLPTKTVRAPKNFPRNSQKYDFHENITPRKIPAIRVVSSPDPTPGKRREEGLVTFEGFPGCVGGFLRQESCVKYENYMRSRFACVCADNPCRERG